MSLYFRIGLDTIIIISICLIYFFTVLIVRANKLSKKTLECENCKEIIKIFWIKLIFVVPNNNEINRKCPNCKTKQKIKIK
ncbi:MAG: hypothetical protein ACOX4W_04625 [Bacilli bacterium]|jgi:hypothetical protein